MFHILYLHQILGERQKIKTFFGCDHAKTINNVPKVLLHCAFRAALSFNLVAGSIHKRRSAALQHTRYSAFPLSLSIKENPMLRTEEDRN